MYVRSKVGDLDEMISEVDVGMSNSDMGASIGRSKSMKANSKFADFVTTNYTKNRIIQI